VRGAAAVRPHPVADQAAHGAAAQLSRHLLGQAHRRNLPRLAAHDQLILNMKTNCSSSFLRMKTKCERASFKKTDIFSVLRIQNGYPGSRFFPSRIQEKKITGTVIVLPFLQLCSSTNCIKNKNFLQFNLT
jgi:hypothetical protein